MRWKWWKGISFAIWFTRERLMDFIELLSYGVEKLTEPLQRAQVLAELCRVLYHHRSSPDCRPEPPEVVEAIRARRERTAQRVAESAE